MNKVYELCIKMVLSTHVLDDTLRKFEELYE